MTHKARTATKRAPALVLYPSIDALTREQLEQHLETVRAKRMVAAIEYTQGQNAKLERAATVIERRLRAQYDMLAKEIGAVDKACEKMDKRLNTIEALKSELGLARDMIVIMDKDQNDE